MHDPGDENDRTVITQADLDAAFEEGLREALRILNKERKRFCDNIQERIKYRASSAKEDVGFYQGQINGASLVREITSDEILGMINRKKMYGRV